MGYSLYNDRKKRQRMIMLFIIGFLIVILVVGAIFFIKGKQSNKKTEENIKEIDTSTVGDASIDPENIDDFNDNGANVNAQTLVGVKGRSNGIDVSKWQGKINWDKVKKDNIDFAFIRIGYRGENGTIYKDDNADYNIQQAQKAGVLVGVYFFSTAMNEQEAIEEANWTIQAIEGYRISYPVVYDSEGFHQESSRMQGLTTSERTSNALSFLKTIDAAGYESMFYGSLSDIQDSGYWNISQIEKQFKVWIAQYTSVPYPEKQKPDYSSKFDAWQYTNKGQVNGITGNVDMVVCYFKNSEAKAKNEKATPPTASAPLTDEEKIYTSVNEPVTAKEITNLRTSATTKSNIVATLKNGETLTRIAVGNNGWSKIQYNNQVVYAISSYLTTDLSYQVATEDIVSGNTFTAQNDQVTAKEVVNLRSLPSTEGKIVGTLTSGEFIQRTAISNKGWSRLQYNGQTVYAITSYLSTEVVHVSSNTPSDGFTVVDEQVTAKEETNLRSQPSTTDSQVVYTLRNGEYVRRIGIHSNGWSKLEYNGQIVYAISSYLTQ